MGEGGETCLSSLPPLNISSYSRINNVGCCWAREQSPSCPNFARMGRNEAGGTNASALSFFFERNVVSTFLLWAFNTRVLSFWMGQPGPGSMDWWHSFTDGLTAAAAHGHMPSAALVVASLIPWTLLKKRSIKEVWFWYLNWVHTLMIVLLLISYHYDVYITVCTLLQMA